MPRLIRWFVKAALVWLIVAMLLKAAALTPKGASFPAITPVSWHLLFVGWLTQLILGMAHWMLPTVRGARKERMRGRENLVWGVFWLLNLGLTLRLVAEPMQMLSPSPAWAAALYASAWLQWLAILIFIANSWRRVRPPVQRGRKR